MNAGLQCLTHIEPLAAYFLDGTYKRELNRDNRLGCGGELAVAFAELQRSLWLGRERVITPRQLHAKLAKFQPFLFQGYQQQDIQEFLVFCLDGLHEDLNRVQRPPPPLKESQEKENARQAAQKGEEFAAALAWRRHLELGKSFLVDLLQGQLRSSLTCTVCGHCLRRFEPFMYLSVPVTWQMETLEDALLKFSEEEQLDVDEQWFCEKCKEKVDAIKRLDIWKLPEVLILHLKRFEFDAATSRFQKIGVKLKVRDQIDLSDYLSSPQRQGANYEVICVANHSGPFGHGHYTATCSVGGRWYHFDDGTVQPLGYNDEAVSHEAYVIFLARREGGGRGATVLHRQSLRRPDLWPHNLSSNKLDFFTKRKWWQRAGLGNRNGAHQDEIEDESETGHYTLKMPMRKLRHSFWLSQSRPREPTCMTGLINCLGCGDD